MALLDTEVQTYERHREELLGAAEGKFVLIHGSDVAGTYDSKVDAIAEGYRRFGNVPFLVKHILEVEVPLFGPSDHRADRDPVILVDREKSVVERPMMARAEGQTIPKVVWPIVLDTSNVSSLRLDEGFTGISAQPEHPLADGAGVIIEVEDQPPESRVACLPVGRVGLSLGGYRGDEPIGHVGEEKELFAFHLVALRNDLIERRQGRALKCEAIGGSIVVTNDRETLDPIGDALRVMSRPRLDHHAERNALLHAFHE